MSDHVKSIFNIVGGCGKEENAVEVYTKVLQDVLGNPQVKDLPVVVISINGRQRTGKSFILTQFLKFLYNKGDPFWINKVTDGSFKWIGGPARVTPGIQIWTEPIIVEVEDSGQRKKVAIILLDCQGLFDPKTSNTQNYKLFAFSAFLSSVFIFNDNTQLAEDTLGFLHSYLEYAKFTGMNSNNSRRPVFQKLLLLNLDWSNDEEDGGYTSYKCGYYDDYTKPAGQNENLKKATFFISDPSEFTKAAAETRAGILESFQETAIFAMAPPGETASFPKPNETSTDRWNPKFRNSVVEFVNRVLNKKELFRHTKKLGGDVQVTGQALLDMSLKWAKVLMSNDGPKIPSSVFETMIDAYYQQKMSAAVERFTSVIRSAMRKSPTGLTEADLASATETAKLSSLYALGTYNSHLGTEDDFKVYKRRLEEALEKEFQSVKIANTSLVNKQAKALTLSKLERIAELQRAVDKARDEHVKAHSDTVASESLPRPLYQEKLKYLQGKHQAFNAAVKNLESEITKIDHCDRSKNHYL